ncbi:hypothetical protein NLM33_44440 [Bradyrhizobium sp. CCGUVB1N3]|uniref:hypothetical protein n=1 Tax=Bradyrhizobium sp. CCGUVB1N3 TaxID=2949629 RepID=UPI0020B33B51|nr:hypothetical protein [Bradyrhizobium sp. CCGUVB1N3]MCP3477212.1 hypothetical protein [Bradyrhizobium sp. CCGUVB1N3]
MRDWWRKWSYEVPLAIGDALWDVLVVQFAALLDRLTVRQVIAFIPVVILVAAYYHRIPIPPELMLIGDFLAYIDIFSVLFLLGVLSRVATVLFVARQATARAVALVRSLRTGLQRLDVRHRRERNATLRPRRKPDRSDDDRARGVAWGQAWSNVAIA